MKVLKGIAIGFLVFFLFWSLVGLGFGVTARLTVLNPDFAIAQFDKANLYPVLKEQVLEMAPNDPQLNQYLTPALQKTLDQLEPWVNEQAHRAIYAAYDYLEGRSPGLKISLPLDKLKSTLKDNLWQEFQKAPPPEARLLPEAQLRQLFDDNYDDIVSLLPSSLDVDESILGADARAGIQTARSYLSYFDPIFYGLALLTALLILGIVLIFRSVRASARGLGITFIVYGSLTLITALIAGYYVMNYLGSGALALPVPTSLESFLPALVNDVLMPLIIFAAGFLGAGIVLTIVSVVYKPGGSPAGS